MQVIYKNMIKTYRGKKDGLVYYYHPGLDRFIAREYVKPRPTENNRKLSAVARNLKSLQISAEYRYDLGIYLGLTRSHPQTEHSYLGHYWSLFQKLMWAMSRQSSIDLEFISRASIYAGDLPCISVKKAVEAGLLKAVNGYELLNSEL